MLRQNRPLQSCWRILRHCCCTMGVYPIILAPLLTAGTFFSVYSSIGCEFIRLEVGFTPSNSAWNSSQANFGLLFHQTPDNEPVTYSNRYRNFLQDSCVDYSAEFQESFMDRDRTWKVSQIFAFTAVGTALASTVISWCIVLLPLPPCLWSAALLPLVMIAFIAEGSKFLIFDVSLCRSALWFPSGVDSLPTAPAYCTIGSSAVHCIVAGVLLLSSLLVVCLQAPVSRDLDPNYGMGWPDEQGESVRSGQRHEIGDNRKLVYRQSKEDSALAVGSVEEEVTSSMMEDHVSLSLPSSASSSTCSSSHQLKTSQVSASRISTMNKILQQQKMHQNQATKVNDTDRVIQELVSELDTSFQAVPPSLSTAAEGP